MVATPDRIGLIIQQFRIVKSGPDAAVVARYGNVARDVADPIETFFDSTADAQTMSDERLALLSPTRRRFTMPAKEIVALPATLPVEQRAPTVTVIDDEHAMNGDCLVVELGLDFEHNQTTFVVWG